MSKKYFSYIFKKSNKLGSLDFTKIHKDKEDLVKTYRELIYGDVLNTNHKRENANINTDTAMGTMLKYGSEGAKFFIDNYILPNDIAYAHINGDIHVHDKDFYMLTKTCCQIDLLKLFKNCFSPSYGHHRETNSITTYSASKPIKMKCTVDNLVQILITAWLLE